MKITIKTIIVFAIIAIVMTIVIWPSGHLISSVKDGNTVILDNGVEVHLIGITSTEQGREQLKIFMVDGVKVKMIPDSKSLFEPNKLSKGDVVYAYLDCNDGFCINESLLGMGVAFLQEDSYLFDRKTKFEKIVKELDPTIPSPTPTIPLKIDYYSDDIKLPNYQMPSERRHSEWYDNGNMNVAMLDEACDYDLPYTKSFANQLAGRSEGGFNPGQICEIFDYCYKKWRYVNDPKGHEYVARASETIASYLTGDCDDFAVLMASCLLAIGADVCVNVGYNSNKGHAFTEVDISQFNLDDVFQVIKDKFNKFSMNQLNYRDADGKRWLNLDWQASYPGGPYYDCSSSRDTYPCIDGKWQWKKLR